MSSLSKDLRTKEDKRGRGRHHEPTGQGHDSDTVAKIPPEHESHRRPDSQTRKPRKPRSKSRDPDDGKSRHRSSSPTSNTGRSSSPRPKVNKGVWVASGTPGRPSTRWEAYAENDPRWRPNSYYYVGHRFKTTEIKNKFVDHLEEITGTDPHKRGYKVIQNHDNKYAIVLDRGAEKAEIGGMPLVWNKLNTWVCDYKRGKGDDSIRELENPYKMSQEVWEKIK